MIWIIAIEIVPDELILHKDFEKFCAYIDKCFPDMIAEQLKSSEQLKEWYIKEGSIDHIRTRR